MAGLRGAVMAAMLCVATVLAPRGEANAAFNAYLRLKGQKAGDIRGSVTQKGREGGIKVLAVAHEISAPREGTTGPAVGKRMHKPFVVTVEVDRATPQLLSAIASGERFSGFALEVAGPGGGTSLYRVSLTNAALAGFEFVTPADSNTAALRLTFTYARIEWTWIEGGITAQDDWEAPVAKKSL